MAVKNNELIDYLGEKLGVPAALRTNAAERAYMLEEQQKQEQVQQAMMAQNQIAMAQMGGAPQGAPQGLPQG